MARVLRGSSLKVPDVPVHQYVISEGRKHGNKTCVIDKGNGRTYTFNDICDISNRTANGLQNKLQMRKGDTIAFLKTNSADFLCVMYGALMAGGTVSTLNPASTAYELKHYLRDLRPRFVFTEPQLLPVVREAINMGDQQIQVIVSDNDHNVAGGADDDVTLTSLQSHPGEWRDAEWDRTTDTATWPALILFSSGTTGPPKGVVLSHRNIVAELIAMADVIPEGETNIACFPMYHIAGLADGGFARFVHGVQQVMFPKFDFEQVLAAIEKYKPLSMALPPPLIVLMVKSPLVARYDVSSIRNVMTGGGNTKKKTEQEFKNLFRDPAIGQVYGMTETCGGVVAKTIQDGHIKSGSVGKVVPGAEAKVINPDSGVMLAPDQRGEICLRGPHVMMGYLNNPQATAQTIDKEGWVHTGDIGYYDDDGYFYIVDRIKELIKYKAFQVAPAEMEAMILEHPDVADVCMIGVPDKMAGELPRAYVVRQPGNKVTEKDIADFVQERASYYKWLRGGVIFVDAIPKLPSGKLLRRLLREQASKSKL